MKFNEYKKEVFSKVYTAKRVQTFVDLLSQLTCALSIYINAHKVLKFLREDNTSKYMQLKKDIEYAEIEINTLYAKIEEFFNEGFFQEITKDQADSISDEYQELVKMIIIADDMIENQIYQKFTDLIKTYNKKVVPIFKIINENIEIYNNKVDEEGWKYKLKTYDEAVDYYNQNKAIIKKNHAPKGPFTEWKKIEPITSFEEFKEQFDKKNNK